MRQRFYSLHLPQGIDSSVYEGLTLSRWISLSYSHQSMNLLCKSMDWFLYDRDFCHERVNSGFAYHFLPQFPDELLAMVHECYGYILYDDTKAQAKENQSGISFKVCLSILNWFVDRFFRLIRFVT